MRIVILGAGGLGSVVGGYLAKVGVDITLIARPAHAEAVSTRGLEISGVRGNFVINENLTAVASPDDAKGRFDYLFLTVKGKDNETALAQSSKLKDRVDTVLSLQNGIGHEEILSRWAGAEKVLGASTIEGGTLVAPGKVVNPLTTPTTAYFGEVNGTVSRRAELLTEAFNRAGLAAKAVTNIIQVEWEKLFQIAHASGYSVSTLAAIPSLMMGDGLLVREGAEHFVQFGKELLSIYRAMGYTPQNFYAPVSRLEELDAQSFDDAIASTLEAGRVFKATTRGRTSMHNDVLAGRKTEVDFILKPVVAKARELGLQVPTVVAVYRIVKVIDTYLK